jgi:hypothetical protein
MCCGTYVHDTMLVANTSELTTSRLRALHDRDQYLGADTTLCAVVWCMPFKMADGLRVTPSLSFIELLMQQQQPTRKPPPPPPLLLLQ